MTAYPPLTPSCSATTSLCPPIHIYKVTTVIWPLTAHMAVYSSARHLMSTHLSTHLRTPMSNYYSTPQPTSVVRLLPLLRV